MPHAGERLVEDDEEHVDEDVVDGEDVAEEGDRAEYGVRRAHLVELKLPDQHLQATLGGAQQRDEVRQVRHVDEVEHLAVGEEHDGEHDAEEGERLRAVAQRRRQQAHPLVEAQQPDELDVGEEDEQADDDGQHLVPVADVLELHVVVAVRARESPRQPAGHHQPVDVDADGAQRQHDQRHLAVVPRLRHVAAAAEPRHLAHLLHDKPDDEEDVGGLADHLQQRARREVAEQARRLDAEVRRHAARRHQFRHDGDHPEQVDARVVDGQLDEDGARLPVHPAARLQCVHRRHHLRRRATQLGHVAAAAVHRVSAPHRVAVQLVRRPVAVGGGAGGSGQRRVDVGRQREPAAPVVTLVLRQKAVLLVALGDHVAELVQHHAVVCNTTQQPLL